jgi:hypothetical protein
MLASKTGSSFVTLVGHGPGGCAGGHEKSFPAEIKAIIRYPARAQIRYDHATLRTGVGLEPIVSRLVSLPRRSQRRCAHSNLLHSCVPTEWLGR